MKHKASLIALFDALIVLEIHFKLNPFFVVASKAEKKTNNGTKKKFKWFRFLVFRQVCILLCTIARKKEIFFIRDLFQHERFMLSFCFHLQEQLCFYNVIRLGSLFSLKFSVYYTNFTKDQGFSLREWGKISSLEHFPFKRTRKVTLIPPFHQRGPKNMLNQRMTTISFKKPQRPFVKDKIPSLGYRKCSFPLFFSYFYIPLRFLLFPFSRSGR